MAPIDHASGTPHLGTHTQLRHHDTTDPTTGTSLWVDAFFAVTTGVFVQGVAMYDASFMFHVKTQDVRIGKCEWRGCEPPADDDCALL